MSTPEEGPLELASQKLEQLEKKRAELEETEDSEQAVALLAQITELAKEAHASIEQARKETDASS